MVSAALVSWWRGSHPTLLAARSSATRLPLSVAFGVPQGAIGPRSDPILTVRGRRVVHGLGWVEIFQFLVGWAGSSTDKVLKIWQDYVNAFKARLDTIWFHQAVKFDFTADLIGTGNRQVLCIKIRHYQTASSIVSCIGLGWVTRNGPMDNSARPSSCSWSNATAGPARVLHGLCRPCDATESLLSGRMSACTDKVWSCQPTAGKPVIQRRTSSCAWCSSDRCQHRIPTASAVGTNRCNLRVR